MVIKKLAKRAVKTIGKKAGKAAGVKRGKWVSVNKEGPLGTPRNVKTNTALGGRISKRTTYVKDETDVYGTQYADGVMIAGDSMRHDVWTLGKGRGITRLEKRKTQPTSRNFEHSKKTVVGEYSSLPFDTTPSSITRLSIGPLGPPGNAYKRDRRIIDIWKEKGLFDSSEKYDSVGVTIFGRKTVTTSGRKAKTGAAAIGAGTTAAAAGYFGLQSRRRGRR